MTMVLFYHVLPIRGYDDAFSHETVRLLEHTSNYRQTRVWDWRSWRAEGGEVWTVVHCVSIKKQAKLFCYNYIKLHHIW